jgi:Flp pilus assembly CpaE family ATPase
MDEHRPFVLVIEKDGTEAALIRQWLTQPASEEFQMQCVESLPVALARIGGGGVDIIVLDVSRPDDRGKENLGAFLAVLQAAPGVPIIVLCEAHDEALALKAMRAGAADYLLKKASNNGMNGAIRSALELARRQLHARNASRAKSRAGGTISFIGAKGGVGATTVAFNVASVLARNSKVILVEMRPTFGTLSLYLQPRGQVRNISHLLRTDRTLIGPSEAGACLWPCQTVPGLRILFGPQTAVDCGDFPPDRVRQLVRALGGLADYVVLDLPAWLSDANRAAAELSGRLVLVVERDPVCVQSAKLMAQGMEAWEGSPRPIQMILVSRAAPNCPMPVPEIETQLGFPALGVVPPEADICQGAEIAHQPIISFEPDSLVAGSLVALAGKCASDIRTVLTA